MFGQYHVLDYFMVVCGFPALQWCMWIMHEGDTWQGAQPTSRVTSVFRCS
jgi:hypothetical protein